MKHIGIVDITTVGACMCANEIVSRAAQVNAGGEHPEFTMHSTSFHEYDNLIKSKDWVGLGEKICRSIKKLHSAGAEFIIMPSNTPHFAIDHVQANSPVPVINLIEIVAQDCKAKGFKNVLVLGTKQTMQNQLYDKALKENDIIPIIPNDDDCDQLQELIRQLIFSKTDPDKVARVQERIRSYVCDGIILGCTELPLVYNEDNLGKPVIDTTRFLGQYALNYAMGAHS